MFSSCSDFCECFFSSFTTPSQQLQTLPHRTSVNIVDHTFMKKLQNKNLVHLTLMNCCINEESYHPDHYAKYTDHLPYNFDEWSIVYPKSISMRIPKQFVTRSIPYERPCGRRHQNGSKRCSATELRCSEDIGKRKWYVPCLLLKAKVKRLLRKVLLE